MINSLDFKSIKRAVKLRPVLRHYHVKFRRGGKDQYRGGRPIHRGDGQGAFHVNLAGNIFHCFACGAGGTVLDFVAAMERCSLAEAALKIQAMTGSSAPITSTPNEKELVTEGRRVPSPLNFKLSGIDCGHPYLAERGITEETSQEFGVGFYAGPGLLHRRLVIPIPQFSCLAAGSDQVYFTICLDKSRISTTTITTRNRTSASPWPIPALNR